MTSGPGSGSWPSLAFSTVVKLLGSQTVHAEFLLHGGSAFLTVTSLKGQLYTELIFLLK